MGELSEIEVKKISDEMRKILGPWRYREGYLDEVLIKSLKNSGFYKHDNGREK